MARCVGFEMKDVKEAFNYGFAVPLEYQVMFKRIKDRFIQRGETKQIHL